MRNAYLSAANQYYLLGVALFLLVAVHASFHQKTHEHFSTEKPQTWHQPLSLNTNFADSIVSDIWQLNFIDIELQLKSLRYLPSGELIVSSNTLNLLEAMYNEVMNTTEPELALGRLQLLLRASLTEVAGKRLSSFIERFYAYQMSKKKRYTKGPNNIIERIQRQQDIESLQKRHFHTKFINALFGKQNKTTHYFNERQAIQLTHNLSKKHKKQALAQLESTYKSMLLE